MNKYKFHMSAWVYAILLTCLMCSCSKQPTDFRSFLGDKEIVYPGVIVAPKSMPGNGRLMLSWHPSPDPSVEKYVVYWNNYADSLVVEAKSHDPKDTVYCLVNNLEEYNYTFFVVSRDKKGNKSIISEIDNAKVYGSIYRTNLINRPVNADTPFIIMDDQTSVALKFLIADTINIATWITYTNTRNQEIKKNLSPDIDSSVLEDYQFGTPVFYQSAYIPVQGAIDTFYTTKVDTFPEIFKLIQCDKGIFREMHLPSDMGVYDGTSLSELWDGATQPKEYPDIFHSDGAMPLPQHFSFDLGKVYDHLYRVQEIGRASAHNPAEFEVWGIADTSGAVTSLPGNDPGWSAEAQSKGWTLLKDVIRTDASGVDPFNATLIENPPPVRFIMIRVLKTVDNSDYVNISQFTFWEKK